MLVTETIRVLSCGGREQRQKWSNMADLGRSHPGAGAASPSAVRCDVPAGSVLPRMTVRRGPVKLPSGVAQTSTAKPGDEFAKKIEKQLKINVKKQMSR